MFKCLLLNNNYETLSFIDFKRAIKLILNEKVDIVHNWEHFMNLLSGFTMNYPSVLRLKKYVPKVYIKSQFNRLAIIKRDGSLCQFCSKKLEGAEITIDHLIPKSKGGKSNFTNCVVACFPCNNKKGNKSLEESKMFLLKFPINPNCFQPHRNLHAKDQIENWDKNWEMFLVKE